MAVLKMSVRDARANFGDLLARVFYTREPVIIEKNGRAFAVVISAQDYEAFWKERTKAFAVIDGIRARNSDKDVDEVERDVTAAVEAVRQKSYDKRTDKTSGSR